MIEDIRSAFQDNLKDLEWMDDETRDLAKEKAAATTDMIGYPDFILDPVQLDKKYKKLDINESEYFGNVRQNISHYISLYIMLYVHMKS